MAATLPNTTITPGDWTELTAVSGITEGDAFKVSNVSTDTGQAYRCRIVQAATKPTASLNYGKLLSTISDPAHTIQIPDGAIKVWAKPVGTFDVTLSLEVGSD